MKTSDFISRGFTLSAALYILLASFQYAGLATSFELAISPPLRSLGFVLPLRELALLSLAAFAVFGLLTSKERSARQRMIIIMFGFALNLLVVLINIDNSLTASAVGMIRMTTIFIVIFSLDPKATHFIKPHDLRLLGNVVAFTILGNFLLCMWQLNSIAGYWGRTTFGPRVYGGLSRPIHMSMYLSGATLFCYFARIRYFWVFFSMALLASLLSGGRAGFIIQVLLLLWAIKSYFRFTVVTGFFGMIILLLGIIVVYSVASSEGVSGRAGTTGGFLAEQRFGVWALILADFATRDLMNQLFGGGLGQGANFWIALYARGLVDDPGQFADNLWLMVLQSYGFVGVFLGLGFFVGALIRGTADSRFVMIVWFFLSNVQVIAEQHPTNLLLMLAYYACGHVRRRPIRKKKLRVVMRQPRAPARPPAGPIVAGLPASRSEGTGPLRAR